MTIRHALFQQYAARVLAHLENELPSLVEIIPRKLVVTFGQEPDHANIGMCEETLRWLTDNGYIRYQRLIHTNNSHHDGSTFVGVSLSDKGLAALDLKINFKGRSQRAGDVLKEQLAKVGDKARDTAISEIVTKVLGALFGG